MNDWTKLLDLDFCEVAFPSRVVYKTGSMTSLVLFHNYILQHLCLKVYITTAQNVVL